MCQVVDLEDAHHSLVAHAHSYSQVEIAQFRSNLLSWFEANARILPWRAQATDDRDKRAYGVWVSEVMLQQTRVATVIEYWTRWMKRWPTVAALASATLEEVHEAWSGLGYYQRAGRLLEGAKMLMSSHKGCLPRTCASLQEIPGIGPYTAGAIASIAFNEAAPVVDGNVMRVLSRQRAIRASPKDSPFVKHCWTLASAMVDPQHPGKFNEALMELGATVCTPQNPLCAQCPWRSFVSFATPKRAVPMPESVSGFPLKPVKAEPRAIWTACALIELCTSTDECFFLLQQRPATGLLANLWEFPGITHDPAPARCDTDVCLTELASFVTGLGIPGGKLIPIGETFHQFSHRSQSITAVLLSLPQGSVEPSSFTGNLKCAHSALACLCLTHSGLSRQQIKEAAVSKGVHKCLALLDAHRTGATQQKQAKGANKTKSKKQPAEAEDHGGRKRAGRKRGCLETVLPLKKAKPEVIVIDD